MRVQRRLDFQRIDVEAGADDQLARAAQQEQGAVGILARQVAGRQPAARRQCGAARGRVAVVAAHASRTAYPQLAGLALRHVETIARHDAHLDAGDRQADRRVGARGVQAGLADGRTALGQAVAVVQRQAERGFDRALEAWVERRAAGVAKAQARRQRPGRVLHDRQQAGIHRRHALHNGQLAGADRGQQGRGIETRRQLQASARVQGAEQHRGQAIDVGDRQAAPGAVLRVQAAQPARGRGHEQQAGVAQHHALGLAGGAGGVHQGRDLVGARFHRLGHAGGVERAGQQAASHAVRARAGQGAAARRVAGGVR